MNHREARGLLLAAWETETGRAPSVAQIQLAQAISHMETGGAYGASFGGSNNFGSVHGGRRPCARAALEIVDPIPWCAASWETPEAGARGFVHQITTRRPTTAAAMATGSTLATAAAMGAVDPITEVGIYHATPIATYAAGMARSARLVAAALGEVSEVDRPSTGQPGGTTGLPDGQATEDDTATGLVWLTGGLVLGGAALLLRPKKGRR